MDSVKLALLVTLVLGIFILLGVLITYLFKKRKGIVNFSIGLAFSVIIMLIVVDLLPEIMEEIKISKIYLLIIFTCLGYLILRFLDHLIPDHEEDHNSENLIHIGIMTSLALGLHNLIEGMAIYTSILANPSLGLGLTLGVGFHNLPLGMVIGGTLHQQGENKYKTLIYILIVSLSTFVGGLIVYFMGTSSLNSTVNGILLSFTLGMLLFILIDELLPRIRKNIESTSTVMGMIVGVIILAISAILF